MSDDYISISEAAARTGLHPTTIRRLLRAGRLAGYKASGAGRAAWLVSVTALRQYADPLRGFMLDQPGPKLRLAPRDTKADNDETG